MNQKRLISKAECARRLGVSATTITKGLKSGRFRVYKRKGKELLDYAECKLAYLHTAKHLSAKVKKQKLKNKINGGREKKSSPERDSPESNDVDGMFDLHDIRLQAERNKALKEKLLLEVALGKYLKYDTVKKEFCNIAENLKKSILAIPHRIGPLLAAESDAHKVVQMMIVELKRSLQGTVDINLKKYQKENEENIIS